MRSKQMTAMKYFILFLLAIIAVWQIKDGNYDFGIGLLVGLIIAGAGLEIKNRKMNRLTEKGMNPYDERVWAIAGKASYAAIRVFAILGALFVLLGSVWGPETLVNPYNLLGICLTGIVFLYVGFYYYYNRKY
jgi:uncharacterized membrane protein